MKITDTHIYFYGEKPFSNWSFSRFKIWIVPSNEDYNLGFTGIDAEFVNSEQAFMAAKAAYFDDKETLKQILNTGEPEKVKQLGRQVKNFNVDKWTAVSRVIMYDILLDKFGQNPDLLKTLLDTGDKVLVEASPYDTVWGVGLGEDDPLILDPANWRGKNLLGFALMAVREKLKDPETRNLYGFVTQNKN
jgi:ribA/ribD-fused uncharacterized protein